MPPLKTWLNWLRLLWTQSHSVSILVSVLADCISRDADPLALRTYVCPPFSFLSVLSEQKRQHWPEEERGEEGGGGRRRRWRRTQTHASLQLLLHHVHHQPVSIYVRVLKKPRPNTVIKHLLCPYWGRRRVIESEAWKCLNSFVVCAVFFHVSTHVCVCLFAPGFASAVTTSWLWSISSSASCPSSPWAASPSLQRTPSGLTHREIMWDIIHCVCVGGNKMFPEDIKMRKNLPKRKHVTNFRKYDGWFRMRLWFWLF